jgi:hypothetical protein
VLFVSQAYLSKKLSLKMEKNLQVLLSAHDMKRPVLPVSKVELAGFWEALGLNNMPYWNSKNSLHFIFWLVSE